MHRATSDNSIRSTLANIRNAFRPSLIPKENETNKILIIQYGTILREELYINRLLGIHQKFRHQICEHAIATDRS